MEGEQVRYEECQSPPELNRENCPTGRLHNFPLGCIGLLHGFSISFGVFAYVSLGDASMFGDVGL